MHGHRTAHHPDPQHRPEAGLRRLPAQCRQRAGVPRRAGRGLHPPELTGPADELARLLQALTPVLGALETSGLVRALHVQDGEVELQLAVRADCGGAALADDAFHTLRKLLPDTDIYVLPAR